MNPALAACWGALAWTLHAAVACERARAYRLDLPMLHPAATVPCVFAIGVCAWSAGRGAAVYPAGVLLACTAVSATTDIRTGYVFDRVLLIAALLLLPVTIATGRLPDATCGAALAAASLLVPYWCTRGRGIGLGDVKLAGLVGFATGTPGAIVAIWFAVLCGGAFAAMLLAARRVTLGSAMRFAPFLALGASYAVARST
jgi:prepilin signal peptidase PulO-like enzyme (type II secretory pathway)